MREIMGESMSEIEYGRERMGESESMGENESMGESKSMGERTWE